METQNNPNKVPSQATAEREHVDLNGHNKRFESITLKEASGLDSEGGVVCIDRWVNPIAADECLGMTLRLRDFPSMAYAEYYYTTSAFTCDGCEVENTLQLGYDG